MYGSTLTIRRHQKSLPRATAVVPGISQIRSWSGLCRIESNSIAKSVRSSEYHSFVKNEPQFAPIVVDCKERERVTSAKLLGLTILSNLMWNEHISDIIKKASERLYFLVQLKRSRVPRRDMSTFYTACIRSVLTYSAPAFFMPCQST